MNILKDIDQLKLEYQKWLKSRPHKLSVFPDDLREEIMTFVNAGRNAEVCRVLGIPSSTVSNWRKKRPQNSLKGRSSVSLLQPQVEKITYSRIDVKASKNENLPVLAEMDLSSADRKVSLRFHDSDCLAKTLAVLMGNGENL